MIILLLKASMMQVRRMRTDQISLLMVWMWHICKKEELMMTQCQVDVVLFFCPFMKAGDL